MGLFVTDTHLYLASGEAGLKIFDISDPTSPKLTGEVDTPGSAWDVWVAGNYAFVADLDKGITVINIASPTAAKYVGQATWAPDDSMAEAFRGTEWSPDNNMAEIIRGSGNLVHIGAGIHGLVTIDISDPQNPQVKDKFKSGPGGFGGDRKKGRGRRFRPDKFKSGPGGFGEGLAVDGDTVYLANGNKSDRSQNGLYVIDVSNPGDLKVLGVAAFDDWMEGVVKSGNRVFVANTYSGVRMVDVANLSSPRVVFHWGGRPRPPRAKPTPTPTRVPPGEAIFLDVTEMSGILRDHSATSLAVEDADKDGDLDILAFGGGEGRDTLYLNQGNLKFVNVAEKAGLPERFGSYGGAWADADNNGLPDIVFAGEGTERLYLNDPSGRFKQAKASNILSAWGFGAWIDYNLDNALDFATYGAERRVLLYENQGNGRFKEVAEAAGIGFYRRAIMRSAGLIPAQMGGWISSSGRGLSSRIFPLRGLRCGRTTAMGSSRSCQERRESPITTMRS